MRTWVKAGSLATMFYLVYAMADAWAGATLYEIFTNVIPASIVFHYHQSCNPPGSQPWDVMINGMDDYIDLSAMVSHYGEKYS